ECGSVGLLLPLDGEMSVFIMVEHPLAFGIGLLTTFADFLDALRPANVFRVLRSAPHERLRLLSAFRPFLRFVTARLRIADAAWAGAAGSSSHSRFAKNLRASAAAGSGNWRSAFVDTLTEPEIRRKRASTAAVFRRRHTVRKGSSWRFAGSGTMTIV